MKGIASSVAVRRALPLLLTALLAPSAHAQNEIAPDQALQLQCGIFYSLLSDMADPSISQLMKAFADSFLDSVDKALAAEGRSAAQRSDIGAFYAAPIADALAGGVDPDVPLDRCPGIFSAQRPAIGAAFAAEPLLHQQFSCGTAFILGSEMLGTEDEMDPADLLNTGVELIEAAYGHLAEQGVDELSSFAISQGYTMTISQALSPDGDGNIGFSYDECMALAG